MGFDNADIQARVYKMISQSFNEQSNRGRDLKVMAWIVNGSEKGKIIACQDSYKDKSGHMMGGKMKGIDAASFWLILEQLPDITAEMDIPHAKIVALLESHLNKMKGVPAAGAKKEPEWA